VEPKGGWLRIPKEDAEAWNARFSLTSEKRIDTSVTDPKGDVTSVRIMETGRGAEGYWNAELMMKQAKNAVNIFEAKYPDAKGVWLFDRASGHQAFAKNALVATRLNKSAGGKWSKGHRWGGETKKMRDGEMKGAERKGSRSQGSRRRKVIQVMMKPASVAEATACNVRAGTPILKGAEAIMRERGIWVEKLRWRCSSSPPSAIAVERGEWKRCGEVHTNFDEEGKPVEPCCNCSVLRAQDDFKVEKSELETLMTGRGHLFSLNPTGHCELNPIEYCWGRIKKYTRQHCGYDMPSLKAAVDRGMYGDGNGGLTLGLIRKYFRLCFRYMSAYRVGLKGAAAKHATKAFKSHRKVPGDAVLAMIEGDQSAEGVEGESEGEPGGS
jgi:hypothetical protein